MIKQKLVLAEQAHFGDHLGVEEEDPIEVMEEKEDEESPWEVAFEKGVEMADDEMIDSWNEDE